MVKMGSRVDGKQKDFMFLYEDVLVIDKVKWERLTSVNEPQELGPRVGTTKKSPINKINSFPSFFLFLFKRRPHQRCVSMLQTDNLLIQTYPSFAYEKFGVLLQIHLVSLLVKMYRSAREGLT